MGRLCRVRRWFEKQRKQKLGQEICFPQGATAALPGACRGAGETGPLGSGVLRTFPEKSLFRLSPFPDCLEQRRAGKTALFNTSPLCCTSAERAATSGPLCLTP